ncbi:hypothetical protein Rhe02_97270 [Rhizocola hellebori]|uniref:Mycothiol-dependent maleylpyruvate isomerase metal-binding domain-containing protein n=1 Tax=Rhizocola hellebori TaxID=1392758 RepID=A0A8J3QL07_9ACTN|nr:TIGR03086 family metal-binding protein [Rhizocola hellebori]GIH11660.1 hypothetical protein Rhe02_97270 [Rhizocola hellebori]
MEILSEAHEALLTVVGKVPDGAWQNPTPCAQWTVTQVVQHAAGDQLAYVAQLTGGPKLDWDPFAPSGTLDVPAAVFVQRAVDASRAAWATVDTGAEAVPIPLPPFQAPYWLAVGACALDAGVHAWDIAVATGQLSPISNEMARSLLKAAEQIVEGVRAWGAYAEALTPPADSDDLAILLSYLGRDPKWTAA